MFLEIAIILINVHDAPLESIYNLGAFLFQIKQPTDDSKERGYNLILEAANRGLLNAEWHMALIFNDNDSDKKQYDEQYIFWLEKAAKHNHINAIYQLGIELMTGKKIQSDFKRAFTLLNQLENNLITVMKLKGKFFAPLAFLYEYGLGVIKDTQKAFSLYEKGTVFSDNNAEYNLARCYEKGIGTQINLFKAQEFYSKAAKHKHPKAMKALELVDILINEQDLDELPF